MWRVKFLCNGGITVLVLSNPVGRKLFKTFNFQVTRLKRVSCSGLINVTLGFGAPTTILGETSPSSGDLGVLPRQI